MRELLIIIAVIAIGTSVAVGWNAILASGDEMSRIKNHEASQQVLLDRYVERLNQVKP